MLRDRHKGLPGRKRNVQEEADRVLRPQPPQLRCERKQVVVVHPDEVVAAQQRLQLFGEPPVDADIALKEARLELRQVQAIVKDRPQHRIAIAEVVGLMVGFRERNGGHAPLALHRGGGMVGLDLAVPAKPQGRPRAHDIGQGDRHAAGLGGLADVGDPVRNQDNAAHTRLLRFLQHRPLATLAGPTHGCGKGSWVGIPVGAAQA